MSDRTMRERIQAELDAAEFDITSVPSHWEKTDERKVIDERTVDALLAIFNAQLTAIQEDASVADKQIPFPGQPSQRNDIVETRNAQNAIWRELIERKKGV